MRPITIFVIFRFCVIRSYAQPRGNEQKMLLRDIEAVKTGLTRNPVGTFGGSTQVCSPYWFSPTSRCPVRADVKINSWSGIEVVITGLTRNQFEGNLTWVQIPPAPPNQRTNFDKTEIAPCGRFLFYSTPRKSLFQATFGHFSTIILVPGQEAKHLENHSKMTAWRTTGSDAPKLRHPLSILENALPSNDGAKKKRHPR